MAVFMLTALGGASRALKEGAENYYIDNIMADIFISVSGIPSSNIENIEKTESVKDILSRIIYDTRVVDEDNPNVITLRIISYDTSSDTTSINAPNYSGDGLVNPMDIMINKDFMNAHNPENGDNISLIIEGREFAFNIVSDVASPEYIYSVKDSTQILPEQESFGFAYVSLEDAKLITGMYDKYNDICIKLEDGYRFDDIKFYLVDELREFELIYILERKNQVQSSLFRQVKF